MEVAMDLSLLNQFFGIAFESEKEPILSIPAADLLNREQMDIVIHKCAELQKAIGLELPATFVGLSLFGLIGGIQLALAMHNRLLDLSLANVTFQIVDRGTYLHGVLYVQELRWTEAPEAGREEWLTAFWTDYFGGFINRVMNVTAESAGVKPDLIWNQFAARMRFASDYVEENMPDEQVKERFRGDHELLLQLAPGIFGRKKNPFDFKPRYLDSPYAPGKKILMRSACCMYDHRENGVKCYNCPRLLTAEREEMRLEIEASRAASS
ncbi:(2Fe-2S)-binding protein [Gorillibacterium massiliense]|uniref:(2Fe-2S)-binding protein n=1 Tax=Gorillibacterium massiliense TaxID=1280390 RepID=UPI0005953685|nr:(2Fe-2S)-binding protein [Gorillibacterium massiliense]